MDVSYHVVVVIVVVVKQLPSDCHVTIVTEPRQLSESDRGIWHMGSDKRRGRGRALVAGEFANYELCRSSNKSESSKKKIGDLERERLKID